MKFEAEGREFAINFEITRTIHLKSERTMFGNKMLFQLVPGGFSDLIN